MELILKGDEIGCISNHDDQSFGMFCPASAEDVFAELSKLRAEIAELEEDKQRLDFLDTNIEKKIGWSVGVAPFGNICISSILMNKTSIRSAIDKARKWK